MLSLLFNGIFPVNCKLNPFSPEIFCFRLRENLAAASPDPSVSCRFRWSFLGNAGTSLAWLTKMVKSFCSTIVPQPHTGWDFLSSQGSIHLSDGIQLVKIIINYIAPRWHQIKASIWYPRFDQDIVFCET